MTEVSPFSFLPLAAQIWLVQMLAFHGFGLWFEWLDRNAALARFKTKPRERRSFTDLAPRVLVNQIFLLLPAMCLAQWAGLAFVGAAHLSPAAMLLSVAGMTVGHDILQYVAHRFILHRPYLIRRLGHALHHSTTGSRAISACYMSATDFLLEIVSPYLIPLVMVGGGGADALFHSIVVTAGAFGGLYEHSGYDFSLGLKRGADASRLGRLRGMLATALSSEAHAAHHSRGDVSFADGFGSPGLCDTIFRTRWDLAPQRRERARA